MKGAPLAIACLLLAACEWNERTERFDDYPAYAASELCQGHFLPADLVPRSARDIRVTRNIDTNEIEATFAFEPKDEAALVRPFLSFDQLRLRLAVAEGIAPASAVSTPQLLLRCGEGAMEFLQISEHRTARYWTSWDPVRRASACSNNATGVTSQ
jgi:hypothetical protein